MFHDSCQTYSRKSIYIVSRDPKKLSIRIEQSVFDFRLRNVVSRVVAPYKLEIYVWAHNMLTSRKGPRILGLETHKQRLMML